MMAKRSPLEQQLLEKAAEYLPGGNNGNLALRADQDFLVAGGKGSHVWDVTGNEYVDWLMGSGPMVLGHAHPRVVEAVVQTVEQGSTFFANNDESGDACRGTGKRDSVRREGTLHHQRHRRLFPGYAGGSRLYRAGKDSESSRAATTAPATTP